MIIDVPGPAPTAPARRPPTRIAEFGSRLYRQTLAEPVAAGRLRDDGWPYGLRALVLLGYGMFALAGLIVVASGAIRRQGQLVMSGFSVVGLPDVAVWPLVLLLSFGVALFLTAALQATWWLKLIALSLALILMGSWSLRGVTLAGSALGPVLGGVSMVALVVFLVVRWRRPFAWWEFAVCWGLVGGAMVCGVAQTRYAKLFGTDFNPLLLQQTASVLGYLALPAAMVAGASVAEITVRATVSATESADRLLRGPWPYVILGVVAAARLGHAGWQFVTRDPVLQDWVTFTVAAVLLAAFGVWGLVVRRVGAAAGPPPVDGLGDELSRIGFAVAAVLVGLALPVQILLGVVTVLGSLSNRFKAVSLNITPLIGDLVDPMRLLAGIVLVGWGVRAARRGHTGRALVMGCVGIMLIALGRALFFGDNVRVAVDADALNLLTAVGVGIAVAVLAVIRRLSRCRAAAFTGVLVLSALFSYRDFISDPLGLLLGFSGAALVLFGLTWDLFTGAQWGNAETPRFARPARVLLVLTNAVLTMTVLAYAALVRDGSTTIYLDPYAELGDFIFGTALLAAAVVALLGAVRDDRPVT